MGRTNDELSKGIFHEPGLLFHGTDVEFKPGDTVLPAQKAGVRPVWASQGIKGEVAYATPDPESAQFFANDASRINRNSHDHPRVYEVEPIEPSDVSVHPLRGSVTRMSIEKGDVTGKLEEPDQHISATGFRVKREAWGPDKRLCRDCSGAGHKHEYVQTSSAGESPRWAKTGNRVHCDNCEGTGLVNSEDRQKGW